MHHFIVHLTVCGFFCFLLCAATRQQHRHHAAFFRASTADLAASEPEHVTYQHQATLLGPFTISVERLDGSTSEEQLTIFRQEEVGVDVFTQVHNFCTEYFLSAESCVDVFAKIANAIPDEETSVTLFNMPVSTLLEDGSTEVVDLKIYSNEDSTAQTQKFCKQYLISNTNCLIIANAVLLTMRQYLVILEEELESKLASRSRGLSDRRQGVMSLPPNTIQQCDATTKSCRFHNLYYDTTEGRFFINSCYPDSIGDSEARSFTLTSKASERAFSLSARSSIIPDHDFLRRDNFNFSTRCIADEDSDTTINIGRDNTGAGQWKGEKLVQSVYINKTVLLARRFSPHNPGHMLLENALPLEKLSSVWGVGRSTDRVILFDDDCFDTSPPTIHCFEGCSDLRRVQALCSEFTDRFVAPLSTTPVQTYYNLHRLARNSVSYGSDDVQGERGNENRRSGGDVSSHYLHLADVLVGISEFTPYLLSSSSPYANPVEWWHLMTDTIKQYRVKMFEHAGIFLDTAATSDSECIKNSSGSAGAGKKLVLTFIYKLGKRTSVNKIDIMLFLTEWCRQHGYELQLMGLSEVSLEYQLKVLAITSVLVTSGGSDLTSALLLPPHTPVIVFTLLQLDSKGILHEIDYDLMSWGFMLNTFRYSDYDTRDFSVWDTQLDLMVKDAYFPFPTASYRVNLTILEVMLGDAVVSLSQRACLTG